jgi:multicomponent Na+:H+ antiporter subunit C
MSISATLVGAVVVLFAVGVYLLLDRGLIRLLLGVILLGNGANLLILATAGPSGGPPILGIGDRDGGRMSDPLPQVMILTAIVITLGMTAFLLAMAYRHWQLTGSDRVADDDSDRRLGHQDRGLAERMSDENDASEEDEENDDGGSTP